MADGSGAWGDGDAGTLLVLGGSRFVGRAAVEAALERGWRVTTLTLEPDPGPPAAVERLQGDRTGAGALEALGDRAWDVVLDTWQGPPAAVGEAVAALAGRCGRYVYVSSLLAHRWPPPRPLDERAPLRDPGAETGDYAARKAAAERIVAAGLGERALIVRPGVVLGPREEPGRLPWWLARLRRGGEVLAPGPPERALQTVDARDLAAWLLDCAGRGVGGAFDLASPPGELTMGGLLEACRRAVGGAARLRWVDPRWLAEAGVEPWTELPLWVPADGEGAAIYDVDPTAALRQGARFRDPERTVEDTWEWLRGLGPGRERELLADPRRLDPVREARLLAAWEGSRTDA